MTTDTSTQQMYRFLITTDAWERRNGFPQEFFGEGEHSSDAAVEASEDAMAFFDCEMRDLETVEVEAL